MELEINRALRIGSRVNNSTEGSVLFIGSDGKLAEDNDNLFWDDANNRLGIGTNAPVSRLHILTDSGLLSSTFEAYRDSANKINFDLLSSRGSFSIPTAILDNDNIARFRFSGFDGTNEAIGTRRTAEIGAKAEGDFSNNVRPTGLFFSTSPTTGATERMRIDKDGKVGIGTSTPGRCLHILGSTPIVRIQPTSDVQVSGLELSGATDTDLFQIRRESGNTGFGFVVNSSFKMFISTSGNIGMGAALTTPESLLHLRSLNSNEKILIENFFNPRGNYIGMSGDDTIVIAADEDNLGAGSEIQFRIDADQKVVIDSSGNVGIGTTAPSANLDISDSSSAALNALELHNSDTTADNRVNILFSTPDTSGDTDNAASIQARFTARSATGVSGALAFSTANNANNPSEQMRIDSDGNVGIGTTSPDEKLQIDGNLHLLTDSQKVLLGTGKDMSIFYDGTDGNIKTDEVAPSDLLLTCGAEKTIELQNTVWDDLRVPVSAVRLGGAQPPLETAYKGGQVLAFPSNVDKTMYFTAQLPHMYKEGTDICLHIHWTIPTSGAGGGAENVKWDVTYSWANIEGSFPAESSATVTKDVQNDTADDSIITDIVTISGTGKTISSQLICSMTRDVSVANDYADSAYAIEVDFHFEINTMGSRQEAIK